MKDDLVIDRLARIETKQGALTEQMEKMLGLMNRIVVVEERQQSHMTWTESRFDEHRSRIDINTKELDSWKLARRVILWVSAILGATTTALIIGSATYVVDTLKSAS